MNAWSHIRSFIYGSVVVGFALTLIALGMTFAPATPIALILVVSFFITAQTAMYTGHKHPEYVYSDEPLDPGFSYGYLSLAVVGATVLQFSGSWLHLLWSPVEAGTRSLPDLDAFLLWLLVGCMMPIFEEVIFRLYSWWQSSKIIDLVSEKLGYQISPDIRTGFAAVTTTLMFLAAHIPEQGYEGAVMLIPITLLFTYLRIKTGGIFTSSVAHVVFNSIAVLMS